MSLNGHVPQDWVSEAHRDYGARLMLYALRIVRDEGRASEVVQETFLKLCREQEQHVAGHMAQWLYTVCRNVALDVRRKESRMSAVAEPPMTQVDVTQPSPLQSTENREDVARVLAALDRLPENQQECIRLKFQHGLSYQEISNVTGLSTSNIGFLIHTGLKQIRSRVT
ncbi:MAG: sigma-70 family RNA polymerase sigma factor [Planctomycetaceae bacterium]